MFNKYFKLGLYLINPTSCDFFSKVRFKYLGAKYWIYWTMFNKYFLPGTYLMEPTSCYFLSKDRL